jgi:hypothetical protein
VKVKVAPLAQQRARVVTKWWRKNRPGAEGVFEREFEETLARLAAMSLRSPIGVIYKVRRDVTIRRFRLPKTEQHIYFSIDEKNDTIVVRAIWGARRGRPPSRL